MTAETGFIIGKTGEGAAFNPCGSPCFFEHCRKWNRNEACLVKKPWRLESWICGRAHSFQTAIIVLGPRPCLLHLYVIETKRPRTGPSPAHQSTLIFTETCMRKRPKAVPVHLWWSPLQIYRPRTTSKRSRLEERVSLHAIKHKPGRDNLDCDEILRHS